LVVDEDGIARERKWEGALRKRIARKREAIKAELEAADFKFKPMFFDGVWLQRL
jgi:hypothetical protein